MNTILAIILYILNYRYYKKNKNFFLYILFLIFIYAMHVIKYGVLDNTLPIFFIFSLLPFIKKLRLSFNYCNIIFFIYFILIYINSCINQGFINPTAKLVIRYICFFILFICDFSKSTDVIVFNWNQLKKVLNISILLEVIVCLCTYMISDDGRLMVNFQCTGGIISVVFSFILFYSMSYFNINYRRKSLCYLFVYLFFAIISGTRGYQILILLIIIGTIFIFYRNYFIALLTIIIPILFVFCLNSNLIENLVQITRITESTGYRSVESYIILSLISNASYYNSFFGYGIGTSLGAVKNGKKMIKEIVTQFTNYNEMWMVNKLLYDRQFHNFYTTTLYSFGLIGIVIFIINCLIYIINLIKSNIRQDHKYILTIFIIAYLIVIWYRWTLTSGIMEMFLIIIFKQYSLEKYKEKVY